MQWQPSASIERLRQRAAFLSQIRAFFAARNVMEVETPALCAGTITDVYLNGLPVQRRSSSTHAPLYLQTSPEFSMKRLLAAGAPDIYQMAKCFREDESGRLHNVEFTMLEWYRLGFSMHELIAEVSDLLAHVLPCERAAIRQMSYQQAFIDSLDIDPLSVTLDTLVELANTKGFGDYILQLKQSNHEQQALQDAILQLLFSQCIEPNIGQDYPVCVYEFPASQASLAKLAPCGKTALRFEFYYRSVELANGFEELTDAKLQRKRFEQDNALRQSLQLPTKPIDERFLGALEHGLPQCSGVALGVDRLIMLALKADAISEVISFDETRA
ncbi:elongation factor P--(R)-beta-lysine ligase [Glaciecola siphonariae]|uniref:Elongation factor P--(R)-beta-lysine ligase n=1 Tax=Glaciecola siphonariae TaxID=521012 RepID=A0ABV9LVE3_9ALTE